VENSEQANQVFQSLSNPVVQKSSNFLIIFLSVLLFISVSIAGFFAYQTQKLAKELTAYSVQKEQQTPTPTPTYEPGLEPEPVPTEVLTKDWKTYTDPRALFSFKYPSNWRMEKGDLGIGEMFGNPGEYQLTLNNASGEISFSSIDIDPWGYADGMNPEAKLVNESLSNLNDKTYYFKNNINNNVYYYRSFKLKNFPNMIINTNYPDTDTDVVKLILSTFKFTD